MTRAAMASFADFANSHVPFPAFAIPVTSATLYIMSEIIVRWMGPTYSTPPPRPNVYTVLPAVLALTNSITLSLLSTCPSTNYTVR